MDGVLNDLRRGVRVLFNMGIEYIVLAADHGHLFAEELTEDMKVDSPGGETADLHRRVWVGHGGNADDALLLLPLSALDMQVNSIWPRHGLSPASSAKAEQRHISTADFRHRNC